MVAPAYRRTCLEELMFAKLYETTRIIIYGHPRKDLTISKTECIGAVFYRERAETQPSLLYLFCKKASNCNTNAIRFHYNRLIAVKRDSSKTNTNKHFCPSLEKQTYAPFISYNNSHQTFQSRPQAWKDLISHGFRKYTLFSPSTVLIRGSSWPGLMSTATTFLASLPAFIHNISLQNDYHLYMQGPLCLRAEYYMGSPLFPEHVLHTRARHPDANNKN